MDENTEAILVVNDHFYRALSLADFNAMQRLWLASDEAVCEHPGWPPLLGWPAIRESWPPSSRIRGRCTSGPARRRCASSARPPR